MAANPNDLSASIVKVFSRSMQDNMQKQVLYTDLGNFRLQAELKKGDRISRNYRSDLVVNDMGADGSYTRQPLKDTEETLYIDKEKEVTFYVKDLDAFQHNYNLIDEYSKDAGARLAEQVDGDFLAAGVKDAINIVDNSAFGGNAGDAITATTSNILSIFQKMKLELNRKDVPFNDRSVVISPEAEDLLSDALSARNTDLGDEVTENGRLAKKVKGFQVYVNNNGYWTGKLLMGTNPTANDTVTINNVKFTFVSSIGTTARNVLIGANAAASITNLVNAINGSATGLGTTYVEVSADDRKLLKNITATAVTDGLTVEAVAKSYVVVAEGLTAAADVWTATQQKQHIVFGQGKFIDIVLQKESRMELIQRTGYIGHDVVSWKAYGSKEYKDGALRSGVVQISSAGF